MERKELRMERTKRAITAVVRMTTTMRWASLHWKECRWGAIDWDGFSMGYGERAVLELPRVSAEEDSVECRGVLEKW